MSIVRSEISRTVSVLNALLADDALIGTVEKAASVCIAAIQLGNKILFAGNGGSAADSQHLSAELVGKLANERPAMPSISLTTDTSVLTAIGNDFGFADIFVRQIDGLGRAGDVFIGISTSGRSKNLVTALHACRKRGIATIGMTGATGGEMLPFCDYCLRMPSDDTQKIQEAHIVVGHILCGLIEQGIFPGGN
jgi:D-sedoheptulose 7-phosphate isomerase